MLATRASHLIEAFSPRQAGSRSALLAGDCDREIRSPAPEQLREFASSWHQWLGHVADIRKSGRAPSPPCSPPVARAAEEPAQRPLRRAMVATDAPGCRESRSKADRAHGARDVRARRRDRRRRRPRSPRFWCQCAPPCRKQVLGGRDRARPSPFTIRCCALAAVPERIIDNSSRGPPQAQPISSVRGSTTNA
jgi:hypothetical protein